jgi:hypothetical protein
MWAFVFSFVLENKKSPSIFGNEWDVTGMQILYDKLFTESTLCPCFAPNRLSLKNDDFKAGQISFRM